MQAIKFYYNKRVVYWTITISTLSFIVFLYKTFNVAEISDRLFYAILSWCWFIIVIFFVRKYFFPALKSSIALELNENAIINNSERKIIAWNEIENVVPVRQFIFGKYTGIAVDLYDNKEYFRKLTFFKKANAFITKVLYKTPIVIFVKLIDYDNEEVILTIQDYFKKIKTSS